MHTGGWIGDMVLLTPALRALKNKFSDCRMTMLLRPLVYELMDRHPYLDEIITYDKHASQSMNTIIKQLKSKAFDMAIILHPNSVSSSIIAYFAHIPERIGLKLTGNSFFLTTKVNRKQNIHEVQRYLNIISSVAGTNLSDKLEFWGIRQEDEDFAKSKISRLNGKIAGINISTTWQTKRWKIEKFAYLTEILYNQLGIKSILTGGKSDVSIGQKIMEIASNSGEYIINQTGRTTLWELGAIIKHCDYYITCDSGPMHISSALETPTIALFGPTDPIHHRPYGERNIVIKKDIECSPCYKRECKKGILCMESINVDDVIDALCLLMR
jgi:heptosyltransferase-2